MCGDDTKLKSRFVLSGDYTGWQLLEGDSPVCWNAPESVMFSIGQGLLIQQQQQNIVIILMMVLFVFCVFIL